MFKNIWDELPAEHREEALELTIACEYYTRIQEVCDKLPDVVKKIQEAGKGHMLPIFFKLAKSAAMSIGDSVRQEAFPVLNAEMAIKELVAIEDMTIFQKEAVDFARLILDKSEDRYAKNRPTFVKKDSGDDDVHFYRSGFEVNVRSIIDKLADLQKRKGLPDEKVQEILQLPNKLPAQAGHLVVGNYEELDEKFPGGIEAFIGYLQHFQKAPISSRQITEACAQGELPKANTALYLEIGALAVSVIGDGAREYFNLGRMKTQLVRLLEESQEKFKTLAKRAIAFATKFGKGNAEAAFSAYARYCLEPDFKSYRDGMLMLLRRAELLKGKVNESRRDVGYDLHKALEQYEHLSRGIEGGRAFKRKRLYELPEGANFKDYARIIGALILRRDSQTGEFENFLSLVGKGFDYKLAAFIDMRYEQSSRRVEDAPPRMVYSLREIDGIKCPIPRSKALALVSVIMGTRNAVAEIYDTNEGDLQWKAESLDGLPRKQAIAKLPNLKMEILDRQLEVIEKIEGDEEVSGLVNFSDLKNEIKKARSLAFFKDIMSGAISGGFNIGNGNLDVPRTGLLHTGNPATKALIAMTSVVVSIGAMDMDGCKGRLEELRMDPRLFLPGEQSREELSERFKKYKFGLMRNVREVIPVVERYILDSRKKRVGLMPVGGKIHTHAPMSGELVEFLRQAFGLHNTSFQLIHAGGSLLLPASMSGAEIRLMYQVLKAVGVTGEEPDLQLCGAGEHPEDIASIIGSSVLLAATRAFDYGERAFSTASHDEATGARIMALGAGVRDQGFPFDVPEARNRTDILAQHDPWGFDRMQILTTMANHARFNRRFGDLMGIYVERLKEILYRHGLLNFLNESAWVFDHAGKRDSLEMHERMVRRFMDEWKRSYNTVDFGIIREVNELLADMEKIIQAQKEVLIKENPDDYEMLLRM